MAASSSILGVVIVSFNTSALLRDCLNSLRTCTLSLRIVVVDNNSADDSAPMVRACFPEVELLALHENLGFAAANNLGMRQLCGETGDPRPETGDRRPETGDPRPETRDPRPENQEPLPLVTRHSSLVTHVLLLNPDTVVHSGAIEALVAFLEAHPRVGMVGPRLLNPDGTLQAAAFRFPSLSMSLLEVFPPGEVLPGRFYNSWWHGRYPQEQAGELPFPIDHPLGACMLVRGTALAEVGGFDESYFMYSEEVEWCWRLRQAGWAIWQVPQARVTHVGGAATRQFRRRMLVELHRSRVHFMRQHYSPLTLAMHRAITRAGMLRAALLAWRDYGLGRVGLEELRLRLLAYGEIMSL
ncbi:MAG: glycosyltransferase family 2 protein [Chloroflexaceae bacterium]|nr:glycosyltransferase family 2 protein [Chloroflexaceae bacterium]